MQTMKRRWAGLTQSHIDGGPVPVVCWELLDKEQLKYEPWTSRSSYHTIGLADEVQLEAVGIFEPDEHVERLAAEDEMWEADRDALEFSDWERRWLADEQRERFDAWMEFAVGCDDVAKLRRAVSKLNAVYHRARRNCEIHGNWSYLYLTSSQYGILRTLIWEKINASE